MGNSVTEPRRIPPVLAFPVAPCVDWRYTSRENMPKRVKPRPARPIPVQLPLFAEAASLARIRPERNEWRFYRMEVGTEGRRRLDPHPDPGAALNALAQLARQKRRRGYQDRAA